VVRFSSRALYPGERNLVVIEKESVLAPEPVGTIVENEAVVVEFEVPSINLDNKYNR